MRCCNILESVFFIINCSLLFGLLKKVLRHQSIERILWVLMTFSSMIPQVGAIEAKVSQKDDRWSHVKRLLLEEARKKELICVSDQRFPVLSSWKRTRYRNSLLRSLEISLGTGTKTFQVAESKIHHSWSCYQSRNQNVVQVELLFYYKPFFYSKDKKWMDRFSFCRGWIPAKSC